MRDVQTFRIFIYRNCLGKKKNVLELNWKSKTKISENFINND